MPKATIEFNLPEEREEYNHHNKANDYYLALWDISQQLRQWRKYEDKETLTMEEVDQMFFNILADYNIEL